MIQTTKKIVDYLFFFHVQREYRAIRKGNGGWFSMRVETTMKDLCRKCAYFDESKVENERYLCPQLNMMIWYEQEYIGCSVFKAREK
jgi:hypothetical protein